MRERDAIYFEKFSRLRALRIAGWSCCALLAACGAARKDPVVVHTGEIPLAGAADATYTHALTAGTYLVALREGGIDARVALQSGNGRVELGDHTPRHGAVFHVLSLKSPDELRITASSTDHPSRQGTLKVSIARFRRAATDAPGELELGYVALGDAAQESARGDADARSRAADKFSEAMTRFGESGDDVARAAAAYALANLQYYARDDFAAAVRASEAAIDAFDAEDDEAGVHNASVVRAAAEIEIAASMNAGTQKAEQRALNAAADRRLEQASEYFASHDMPLRAAYAVNFRGVRALNVGENAEAGTLFARALAMARANQDVVEEMRSLNNLAWVHRLQGFVSQAASEYQALLPLLDPKRQAYLYAAVLSNYGFCLIALGDFDRALELHTQALDLFTQSGDESERATQLAALGSLFFRIGDTQRALVTLRAAIEAQQRVSDSPGLASSLRLAGNAASVLGQHDLALDYLRRSAGIDANPNGVARTRVLIASELRALGDLQAAENELAAALTAGNALARAQGFEERARVRLAKRETSAAISDLRDADRQYRQLSLDFNRIDINATLAQALLKAQDVPGATAAADEAVAIAQRIRAKSANPEWRARFLSSRYAPYEARIAVELAARPGDKAASWKAFRTAEDVRARSLHDQLAFESRASLTRTNPEIDALRTRLTSLQMRMETRMQRADADEATTLALRRDIEETRAQLDAAANRERGIGSGELELPAELAAVQAQLPANTAVLAYFVGDSQSHAWLLTRSELRHAPLAGRETLQRAIDAATGGNAASAAERRRLGEMLFGKLLDGTRENRMLLLADGPLNGVPFAALPLPDSAGELLIDRFVLGYAPSLALAMQERGPAGPRGTRVAVVSDPVYGPDDRRLPAPGSPGNLRGPRQVSPHKLTRLPYSALEARAVVKTFGQRDTIELSGFDATPERVLQLPSRDLAVLHFATHAQARNDSPEQSALFLTEYAADGALLPDSRLTAGDVTRRGLRADVVVLSGCATGDGSTLRGEGVLGLTYSFLVNGSRSVVASLWPVEDASTARFMNEFYRSFRENGSAAEALRSAQLRTRGSAAAPVWSSFVVRANGFP